MAERVTDEMVERAWAVLREEINPPYMARAADYITANPFTEERALQFAALKAADREAGQKNRDMVRRALAAALDTATTEQRQEMP